MTTMMMGSASVCKSLRLICTRTPSLQRVTLSTSASHILQKNSAVDHVGMNVSSFSTSTRDETSTVLVLGSSGALGSSVSRHLGKDLGMSVIGADLVELEGDTGWELDGFVALPHVAQNPTLADLTTRLVRGVGEELPPQGQLDAIVVASGGWEGDPKAVPLNATNEEVQAGAVEYGECIDKMIRMNLHPVLAAGHVAERYMGDEGLFVVMGATAALAPTPGMMGYGVAKSAAHHFVQTLGASTGKSATSKPKRKEGRRVQRTHGQYLDTLTVIGMLPTMIDTPANRRFADAKADFSKWTKPIDIAQEIGMYIENPPLRPHSGSLIKVFSDGGENSGATFHLVR